MSKKLWIVAYLEETKISDVHTGQTVKFTIDAFPDVKFTGKVFLVGFQHCISFFRLFGK